MIERLRELYRDDTARAQRFRYGLLIFDLVTVVFVITTSFIPRQPWIEVLDLLFGVVILGDFITRLAISRSKARMFMRFSTWADLIALVSFLAPVAGEGFGFLRILRTLRLLHTYQILERLRRDFGLFRRNEDVALAVVNLLVFIFVMTGLIYATQATSSPDIENYADALYFTVTALTTTGFGDITLEGTGGKMLSVLVMIIGVTLFLRLAQVLFRPRKVQEECTNCGLQLHDADAIHCKHCGEVIRIRTEGQV